jgi:hypothetical protein
MFRGIVGCGFFFLPVIDCSLITQSLDDHCHLKTLKPVTVKLVWVSGLDGLCSNSY